MTRDEPGGLSPAGVHVRQQAEREALRALLDGRST
jgi:hypothetical protein